jgi:hypothetical protein
VSAPCSCRGCTVAYDKGRKDAATDLWHYFNDKCGPISGKGMTNGPVCVDEAVALMEGPALKHVTGADILHHAKVNRILKKA